MELFKTITLDSVDSTNNYAKTLPVDPDNTRPVVVITDNQTAGRGQRGNSWESEPGANLTFSLVVYPRWMSPARQFELSMLVSLGIINGLRAYVDNPEWLKIKWPNDIYFGNRKLAGILIENSVSEQCIERSIIGIGLNINQKEFCSDAPNPISLCHVTGFDVNRDSVLNNVVENIIDMLESYADNPEPDELCALYDKLLWRNDGEYYEWIEPDGRVIEARIESVDVDGRLHLQLADGSSKSYLFKEIAYVL